MGGRMRGLAVVAVVLALAGCRVSPQDARLRFEPYLLVWAGDDDRSDEDFLAVIDANPGSRRYGRVLATIPVGSAGNEPHGINTMARGDGAVVTTGVASDRVFVFDMHDPLH